jgi:hypothetical protein
MIICRLDGRLARLLRSNEKRPGPTSRLQATPGSHRGFKSDIMGRRA